MIFKSSLHKTTIILLLFYFGVDVYSQNSFSLAAGARQASMAYTTVATGGFWASFHSQGALGREQRLAIGLNHESRFGLAELSNKTFGLIVPTGHGSVGAIYSYYGYEDYNRHTAGLAYGLPLGDKLHAGVQLDFYSTRQAGDYENTNDITFEAGIQYIPVENLIFGLHFYNPLPNAIRDHEIPTVITLGMGYNFSPGLFSTIEFEGTSDGNYSVKAGGEFQLITGFYLRAGLMSNPVGFSFGTGFTGRFLQADIGFLTHEELGLTPSISFIIFIR